MAAIHRLLCTHCTFGTSELESSSADNAGKVLGYSVRKSSLPDAERGQLRQVFRAVERLLSYGLPKDATAAHKETLSADTAPRRLIFFPNLGGWQVAGQVSYRTFDTSQPPRPGSYFADLIVAKAPDPRSRDPEPAWSPCDVLQLWAVGPDRKTRDQAGWWISSEDELAAAESEGPWKPIAPPSVAAVREPRLPLIDDDAAHRFLAADAVAADPLVPARWWAMPAERRRELVAQMLQATIQGPARGGRETVTIAAEPSVAAVLFYIVCRLLPRRIAAGVSFSTYEPAPERPLTGVVATTFLNEEAPTADLPPELAQRGFACNTFRDVSAFGRCQPPPEQGYAHRLVALAAASDWAGIDSLLAALDAEGLKAADLDQLIKIDHLVTAYFSGEKPTGLGARRGPQEARFLRERFRGVLETQAATRADWPSDLLEAAIFCLEGDLETLWTAGGPVQALLERHLPVDGDGLGRLLEPPQGRPSPPPTLVATAVVSATLRGKPPHLPSRFVKHCRDAREGRNRVAAVDLLGAVIRGLPEDRRGDFLVGADSASITDLLIDVFRNLSPPERDGLRPALTESLSSAIWKLTAKDLAAAAELLHRQADAASWTAASHPGLQEHLDGFFRAVLDDDSREPGSHLVDAAGRSRVARLQQWTDHAGDRRRIGETLSHWKALHDAVTRLAADAPAWRSWAKPAAPEGREIPAAVAAIDGLRPFDVANRIKARERQQGLAKTVVQTFKQAQPEGSDLRAGWETVGNWLDQALAEEAERRAPGPVRGASYRSTAATYGLFGGIAALIALVAGFVAYSQGGLNDVLPEAWRRQAADTPKDPDKTDPSGPNKPQPEGGSKPVDPRGMAATTGPAGGPLPPTVTPEPAAQAPPEPAPPPPLKAADVDLKLALDNGKIVVTWNHGILKDRINLASLTWKGPEHAEPQPLAASEGSAQINTKGCGFGPYVVTLRLTPKQGQGDSVEKSASQTIAPPHTQVEKAWIDVRGDKPSLVVKVAAAANQKAYGAVSYRFNGPQDFSSDKTADGDGTVDLELPADITPASYQAQPPQFTIATVVHQGITDPVPVPAIPPPDANKELLATLKKQDYITAQAADPGKEAQPLCDLPWSVRPEQFDVCLMTPEFKPGISLTLGPKDTRTKSPRWPCNAMVTADAGVQDALPVTVGHFEFDASSPWQPRLRFKVAEKKETGHEDAYAALRCCRLCLVIAGQPVATCQMQPVQTLGRLTLSLPEGDKERQLPELAVPQFLHQPQLAFEPKEAQGGPYAIRTDVYKSAVDKSATRLLLTRHGLPLTQANLEFKNGRPTLAKTIWAPDGPEKRTRYESKGKAQTEADLEKKKKALADNEREIAELRGKERDLEPKSTDAKADEKKKREALNALSNVRAQLRNKINSGSNLPTFIKNLTNTLARIAEVETLNDVRFILDDWSISVDTTLRGGTNLAHDGNPLVTRVVLFKGSAKDPPLEFRTSPTPKDPDIPLPTDQ